MIVNAGGSRAFQPLPAGHPERERHRRIALQRIQQQRSNRQPLRSRARDIRRPNIAAAGQPHVFFTEDTYQQIAKRNRSQQVGDRDDDEDDSAQGAINTCR